MTTTIQVPQEKAEHLRKLADVDPKALAFLASLTGNQKALDYLTHPLKQAIVRSYIT